MKKVHHKIGQIVYIIIFVLGRVLPYSQKPRTRVVAVLNDREVLLVKNWLSRQLWALPGGGIKSNETPVQSAARELYEETGLSIEPSNFTFLGYLPNPGLPKSVMVFRVNISDSDSAASIPPRSRYEIIDLGWHPIVNLPSDRMTLIDEALTRPAGEQ